MLFLYATLLAGKTNLQNPIWIFLTTIFPDEETSEMIPLKFLWKIQKEGKHPEMNTLLDEISKEISSHPSVSEAWKVVKDEGKTEQEISGENSNEMEQKKLLAKKRKEEILLKFQKEREKFSQSVKKFFFFHFTRNYFFQIGEDSEISKEFSLGASFACCLCRAEGETESPLGLVRKFFENSPEIYF